MTAQARRIERLSLATDPQFVYAWMSLGKVYAVMGRYDEAITASERAAEISVRSPFVVRWLGWVYAVSGRQAEARRIIGEQVDPAFDPLRMDPRFTALVRKIGLD